MTELRHTEGLRQIYDKTWFTKYCTTKLRENVWQLLSCCTTASACMRQLFRFFISM